MIHKNHSLYWDDFEKRISETVHCIKNGVDVQVRRIAVFITNKCNMQCSYCKHEINRETMSKETFEKIIKIYGDSSIIHITGGEPSTVSWLYPYLEKNYTKYKFHLNTNAFICPPSKAVKRLKISLDSNDQNYWDKLVGKKGAFEKVVRNIKLSIPNTVVSITYTITKENYRDIPKFIDFSNKEFVGLHALFFSIYKGNNLRFIMDRNNIEEFFNKIVPIIKEKLVGESLNLFNETIPEKIRIREDNRFPENGCGICYLSLSERTYNPAGMVYGCSHLYRDHIYINPGEKDYNACRYGCNLRLVTFNKEVNELLKKKE